MFSATHVPVGDDQSQHIELCADLADLFNRTFKRALPEGRLFPIPRIIKSTPIPSVHFSSIHTCCSSNTANSFPPRSALKDVQVGAERIQSDPSDRLFPRDSCENPSSCDGLVDAHLVRSHRSTGNVQLAWHTRGMQCYRCRIRGCTICQYKQDAQ